MTASSGYHPTKAWSTSAPPRVSGARTSASIARGSKRCALRSNKLLSRGGQALEREKRGRARSSPALLALGERLRRPAAAERFVQVDQSGLPIAQCADSIALGAEQAALCVKHFEIARVAVLVAQLGQAQRIGEARAALLLRRQRGLRGLLRHQRIVHFAQCRLH